jgi:histidine phosphotransfer protein HptB
MSGENSVIQFDPSVLDSLHEAIGDGINRIITVYVDDFPKNIECMRVALNDGELETVGRLAHSLKSSSGNLGALELMKLSANLEQAVKTGSAQSSDLLISINNLEASFKLVLPRILGYIR